MRERDYEAPKYEHPVDEVNWTAGVGRPAGVYWLDGRTVIAACDSAAEGRLMNAGAVQVALLRFDPDPAERVHRGRTIERMRAARLARTMPASARN